MDKIQEEIIEEFSVFDDWLDKYDYLIGLSETLPPIAPEHRTEQYLISGCQSRVWVDARLEEGRIHYSADSDAIITKGSQASASARALWWCSRSKPQAAETVWSWWLGRLRPKTRREARQVQ